MLSLSFPLHAPSPSESRILQASPTCIFIPTFLISKDFEPNKGSSCFAATVRAMWLKGSVRTKLSTTKYGR